MKYRLKGYKGPSSLTNVLYRNRIRLGGRFLPDEVSFPENYLWHPNFFDHLVVFYAYEKFEFVMSMIRLEKPLNLYTETNQGEGLLPTVKVI